MFVLKIKCVSAILLNIKKNSNNIIRFLRKIFGLSLTLARLASTNLPRYFPL